MTDPDKLSPQLARAVHAAQHAHGPEYARWFRAETWKARAADRVRRDNPGVSLSELVRRGLLDDDVWADDCRRRDAIAQWMMTEGWA